MLQIGLEDHKQKTKGKKKAHGPPPQNMLSKQPVTTAASSSKLAAPLLPDKTTATAAQDFELANVMSPTAIPATLSAPSKTPSALPQALRQRAPTLTIATAIRMRSAALCATRSPLTTKHAGPKNAGHNKPRAPLNLSDALPFTTAPPPQANTWQLLLELANNAEAQAIVKQMMRPGNKNQEG